MPVTSLPVVESVRGEYAISTDPARLDYEAVHAYLTESYWARGRTYATVVRALQNSLCFGLYQHGSQIGLARVVSDFTVFAYLCDVYILADFQRMGLGAWLIEAVLGHPELQTVRRWTLVTDDAHEFYARAGFGALATPGKHMELIRVPQR